MSYCILVPTDPHQDPYVPSYNCGFVTAGSVFFHKSSQIWEIVGIPRPTEFLALKIKPGFYKAGNFTEKELRRNYFRRDYLHFGKRGEAWYCSGDGSKRIRLRWRRCSLTEIRLRQIISNDVNS